MGVGLGVLVGVGVGVGNSVAVAVSVSVSLSIVEDALIASDVGENAMHAFSKRLTVIRNSAVFIIIPSFLDIYSDDLISG